MSVHAHPITFLQEAPRKRDYEPAIRLREMDDGLLVGTVGLVLLRQRPETARGITFVTLEDETGVINLIVHPKVWQKYRDVARAAKVWLVDGQLQRQGIVSMSSLLG